VRIVRVSDIKIGDNRQRREFDPEAVEELRASIEATGLQHAIVVRDTEAGIVLVAGERRLRALESLWLVGGSLRYDGRPIPQDHVPTVTLGELTELEAEEAELDENLKRRDLTWQETADAVARLHALRQKQFKKHLADTPEALSNPQVHAPTFADTARELNPDLADKPAGELGSAQAAVRKQILVAAHLNNPVIAKAKSVDEAFKLLKAEESRKQNTALAALVAQNYSVRDHTLLKGDCLIEMGNLVEAGKRFDVILTDPPYGMGAHEFGDGGGKLGGIEHHYDDSYASWQVLMSTWSKLSFDIAKPAAHAYVFCDFDRFHELKQLMQAAGWYVFRTPLINYKANSGRVPLPDRGPRRQYEIILYAIKGNKPVTHIYSDVIQSDSDEQLAGGHGAQKPVSLYQNLLMRSVRPGDFVLDSFAGSGTIFPAAHAMKCLATGIEKETHSQGLCLKRLDALALQEDLPGIAAV
jgi:ParB-like chromosome segregation protein Spo0J